MFALVAFSRSAIPHSRAPSRSTFSGVSRRQLSLRSLGAPQPVGTGATCAIAKEDTIDRTVMHPISRNRRGLSDVFSLLAELTITGGIGSDLWMPSDSSRR